MKKRTLLTLLALLLLGFAGLALGQLQPRPEWGGNNCGTVNCPEGCTCEITPCDKSLQPNCIDIGLCDNCPIPIVEGFRKNLVLVTIIVLSSGAFLFLLYRRRRSRIA